MALPTVVTSFLTRIKDSLKQGSDLGSNVRGAAQNYLLAQDMATVLDLLQDAMDQGTDLTATGGSTTTVVDGAGTFVANQQAGNIIVFGAATTTVALRSLEFRVSSNTATTLTVPLMPAAAVAGDVYTIRGGWFDSHISNLRGGRGLADAPRGSVLGDVRQVLDALITGLRRYGVKATGVLTQTGQPANTNTVVLGSKTYTFQTSLTNVDGNVAIGATAADSLTNLIAAITLGAGSGTAYAASMTANTDATASLDPLDATKMDVEALGAGTAGNALTTTETHANASYGAATMAGGLDGGSGVVVSRQIGIPGLLTGVGSTDTKVVVDYLGGAIRIDQFRGYEAVVGSEARIVVSSDELGSLTLSKALSSAPSSGAAVSIQVPEGHAGGTTAPKLRVHPGAQPGENAALADLIGQLEALLGAYDLPT